MTVRIWAVILLPVAVWAQDVSLDLFSALLPKATEHVEVNLGPAAFQLAAGLLSNKEEDEAKLKELFSGVKGIYVRSLTFAKPGEYSRSDIDKIRAQLKGWSQIVNVHEADEDTGIYVKTDGHKIQGMVILAAEPTELTLVNIVGMIRLDQIKELSGKFGIPDLGGAGQKADSKTCRANGTCKEE